MKRLRLYRHSAAKSVGVGSAFFLANEWAARRGAGNLRSGHWISKTVRSTSLEMGELALTHSFAKDANEWGTRQLSVGPPIRYVSAGTPSISVSKLTTKTTTTSGCH